MTEITINRVHARMKIPPGARSEETRIKRVIAASLAQELEAAIERRSIGVDGYLCIPSLQARAVLRLGRSDADLAASAAQAIADAISVAIRGTSCIYYTSRAHVLTDLVASAMRADFTRAWAWSQLVLWQESGTPSARLHANQAVQVLTREARHAVAVTAHVARDSSTLPMLLRWADARFWTELARAASRAHGSALDPEQVFGSEPPASQVFEISARFIEQSAIARALKNTPSASLPDKTAAAIAILAMLEVEPAAIHSGGPSVYAVLRSIATLLKRSAEGAVSAAWPDARSTTPPSEEGRRLDHRRTSTNAHTDQNRSEPSPAEAGTSSASREAEDPRDPVRLECEQPEHSVDEVRKSAATEIGGLTYLLNAAARIDLPALIMRDHRLGSRGLRWTLYQLGLALVAPEPGDPALLAFAGLLPDSSPPTLGTEPPRDEELAAVEEYRAMLVACLRRAIGDRMESADISDDALIGFMCRRRAMIVGDPGWLEVHFSIEEAAPEIRFAGLDLDPGWLPWLGLVVKFVYA